MLNLHPCREMMNPYVVDSLQYLGCVLAISRGTNGCKPTYAPVHYSHSVNIVISVLHSAFLDRMRTSITNYHTNY